MQGQSAVTLNSTGRWATCLRTCPSPTKGVSSHSIPLRTAVPTSSGQLWLKPAGPYHGTSRPGRAGRGSACRSCTLGLHSGTQAGHTRRLPQDRPLQGRGHARPLSAALSPPSKGSPPPGPSRAAHSPHHQTPPGGRGHLWRSQDPCLVQLYPSLLDTQLLHPRGLRCPPTALRPLPPSKAVAQDVPAGQGSSLGDPPPCTASP